MRDSLNFFIFLALDLQASEFSIKTLAQSDASADDRIYEHHCQGILNVHAIE